jgi:hypothetical protein
MHRGGLPCVVHLVRHGNPPESFERFIESYRRCDAGVEHRLVLLFKGFPNAASLTPVLERLDGVGAEQLEVPDDGFDLTAYRRAAARLDGATGCYLNSNSTPLSAGWLEQLLGALGASVGIVGATGSWSSAHSNARYLLRIPGAYGPLFPDRAWYQAQACKLADEASPTAALPWRARPPLRYARTAHTLGRQLVAFRPYPSCHVRTNAFVIRSETMARLRFPPLGNKARVWQLESGRGSITEQIESMGLQTLVVGRDGRSYGPPEWADSDTLWQGNQANLLVADNQTERYRNGDLDLRTMLSRLAWGTAARPLAPDVAA